MFPAIQSVAPPELLIFPMPLLVCMIKLVTVATSPLSPLSAKPTYGNAAVAEFVMVKESPLKKSGVAPVVVRMVKPALK